MDYSDLEDAADIADELLQSDNEQEQTTQPTNSPPTHVTKPGASYESEDDFDGYISTLQSAANRRASNIKGTGLKKGGGFQSMGLDANILKAITKKGFKVPTPIQRKAVPLLLDGRDVVGMARTGSGKTAAFAIPLIQKLRSHSVKVGARALILSPSRELALQTLLVVKELGKGTELKSVLLVGGESMEHQFAGMTSNPDIIIATPGRFMHLKVEMGLDMSTIKYVVFDEADRLFEMGFASQLHEIIHALPSSRQTSLFSATLPSNLVEFARAGLQEPELIRLDAESKISPDLESAFFTLGSGDKEASLLQLLHNVIKIPTGPMQKSQARASQRANTGEKRKRDAQTSAAGTPTAYSTIIFAATKHHVEYLAALLKQSGYPVSAVYGSLDQTARSMQVEAFREGLVHILVVTDVAARGIDIPVLANVVNYDLPAQPKIFVHRVGRTARAGQPGRSFSLVTEADLPYLLDLQLFLGRNMHFGPEGENKSSKDAIIVGGIARNQVETWTEWLEAKLNSTLDLSMMKGVTIKAEKQYNRSRGSAAAESVRRAKKLVASGTCLQTHPMFKAEDAEDAERQKERMLSIVSGFKPKETVFEVGMKGKSDETNEAVRRTRQRIAKFKARNPEITDEGDGKKEPNEADRVSARNNDTSAVKKEDDDSQDDLIRFSDEDEDEDDDEYEVTLTGPRSESHYTSGTQSDFFLSYTPTANAHEARAYSVNQPTTSTSNFAEAARFATLDLTTDEAANNKSFGAPSKVRWDRRAKKYVARANDEDGSKEGKSRFIMGEGGQKIAASFKSGVFDRWRKAQRISRLPRVGETESNASRVNGPGGGMVKRRGMTHYKERAPKAPDKWRDDYHKQRKKAEKAKEASVEASKAAAIAARSRGGVKRNEQGRKVKKEVRSNSDVRKARVEEEKRRAKTGRPQRKGMGGKKGK